MTVKQHYGLKFETVRAEGRKFHFANPEVSIPGSMELAQLLNHLGASESSYLLESINDVISSSTSEISYSLDNSQGVWVEYAPPNCTISGSQTMTLIDLKSLVEEWISFTNS
ncbi:MAG: hypothetical protein HWE24_00570 [Oceanospirillaceae bacterium]|nr:hypothetical protein [Oceanospirillaceae bacterium]